MQSQRTMLKRDLERGCLLAMGLWLSGCAVVAADLPFVPMAAPGVRLRADVARGYAEYFAALAPYGTWGPDAEHGVRWCPRSDTLGDAGDFQPYASRGHWDAAEAPVGHAPAGSPVWTSEDSDTWGTVTTRHGWWVHVEPSYGPRRWCWVPGAEETPGRVVWRTGDGFVGWAPEAPAWAAYDAVDYDSLDWVFSLIGTLLDDTLNGNLLTGDARETARHATDRAPMTAGPTARRQAVGPSAAKVGAARKALSEYAALHQVTFAEAVARVPASGSSGSARSGGSGGSSKSSKSSASDASDASAKKTSAPRVTASMYADAMMADPMYMPGGYMPRLPRAEAVAQPRSEARADGPNASVASAVHGGSSSNAHTHTGGSAPTTYHPSTSSSSSSKRSFSSSSSKRSSSSSSGRSSSSSTSSSHHR